MTTTARCFAAIQAETQTVFGVGSTPDGARHDAKRYTDSPCPIVPCTLAALEHVRHHGGAPDPRLTVTARGVSLRSEEE